MQFQPDADRIQWRLHLRASPERVFAMLATPQGRRQFWAESAEELDGYIDFHFPDGSELKSRILATQPPVRFSLEYFAGTHVQFELSAAKSGGTDLLLTETNVPPEMRVENIAGWVSVLLTLKAAVDYGIDLRNRDRSRTWGEGFVDN